MSHRGLITSVAAMAVAAVMVTGVAQADGGGLVRSQMVACVHAGTVLGGVNQCGKIWQLAQGDVSLDRSGRLRVAVRGLFLNNVSTGSF